MTDMTTKEFVKWLNERGTPANAARELRSRGWKQIFNGKWAHPRRSARSWQEAILTFLEGDEITIPENGIYEISARFTDEGEYDDWNEEGYDDWDEGEYND